MGLPNFVLSVSKTVRSFLYKVPRFGHFVIATENGLIQWELGVFLHLVVAMILFSHNLYATIRENILHATEYYSSI